MPQSNHHHHPRPKHPRSLHPSTSLPSGPTRTYTLSIPWTPTPTHNTAKAKARIRDITRLLSRKPTSNVHDDGDNGKQKKVKNLPAHVRTQLEREIAGLKREEAVARSEELRRQVMKRDKRIKFFDLQTTRRKLKKLERTNDEENVDSKKLDQIRRAEIDYNYAQYYPLGTKYVPLFPKKKDSGKEIHKVSDDEEAEELSKGNDEMRLRIVKAMSEGKSSLERLKNEIEVVESVTENLDLKQNDDEEEFDDGFFE